MMLKHILLLCISIKNEKKSTWPIPAFIFLSFDRVLDRSTSQLSSGTARMNQYRYKSNTPRGYPDTSLYLNAETMVIIITGQVDFFN
jgi:maltodextrin utilization protein YvdJ